MHAGGVPDNLGFDLRGGTLAFQAMAPALVPVNRTQPKPFIRTFDVYEFHAGVDHLNVLGGATTAAVNGTLDVTQVAAPDLALVTDGLDLQRHDGTRSERLTVSVGGDVTTSADVADVSRVIIVRLDTNARVTGFGLSGARTLTNLPANVQVLVVYATEKKFYVGGEPVHRVELFVNNQGQQDARLVPITYAGGEPVLDVLTGMPLLDRNGVQLLHAPGDAVLHFRGEAVLHHAGRGPPLPRWPGGSGHLDADR